METYNLSLYFSGICMFYLDEGRCTVYFPTSQFPDGVFPELEEGQRPYPHFPRLVVPSRNLQQIGEPSRRADETRSDVTSEELAIFRLEGDNLEITTKGSVQQLADRSSLENALERMVPLNDFFSASQWIGPVFQPENASISLTFSIGDLSVEELGKIKGEEVTYTFQSLLPQSAPPSPRTMAEVVVLHLRDLTSPVILRSQNPLRPPIVMSAEPGENEVKASVTNIHDRLEGTRDKILDFFWYYSMFDPANRPGLRRLVIPEIPQKLAGKRTGSSGECPPTRFTSAAGGGAVPASLVAPEPPRAESALRALFAEVPREERLALGASRRRLSELNERGLPASRTAKRILSTRTLNELAREVLSAESFEAHITSVGSTLVGAAYDGELSCVALGNSSSLFRASGVLIEPDVVLTAAHVFKEGFWPRIGFGTTLANLRLVVNGIAALAHPDYQSSPNTENDLAVILLDRRIKGVEPAIFAKANQVDLGSNLFIVGFGATDDLQLGSKNTIAPKVLEVIGDRLIAGAIGMDTCTGDSGGPVYVKVNAENRLVAITSEQYEFFNTTSPCGDGGAYQRVDLKATRTVIADMIKKLRLQYPGEQPEIEIPTGP